MIGPAAARLDARGATLYALGWITGCAGFLPLALWAESGAPRWMWLPASIGGIASLTLYFAARRTASQSAAAASQYAGERLGYPVRLRAAAYSAQLRGYSGRWQRELARAEGEHARRLSLARSVGVDATVEALIGEVAATNRRALFAVAMIGAVVGLLSGFALALVVPDWTGWLALSGALLGVLAPTLCLRAKLRGNRERLREVLLAEVAVP